MRPNSISVSDLKLICKALKIDIDVMFDTLDLINRQKERDLENRKNHIKFIVDYSLSLEQMLFLGHYDWVNKDVNEHNFPTPHHFKGQKKLVSAKLFRYKSLVKSKDVIADMKLTNYRPANLFELLFFSKFYPELSSLSTVALNSVWKKVHDGQRLPVLLVLNKKKCGVALDWIDRDWNNLFQFLGILNK
jgi:hypothetical protein